MSAKDGGNLNKPFYSPEIVNILKYTSHYHRIAHRKCQHNDQNALLILYELNTFKYSNSFSPLSFFRSTPPHTYTSYSIHKQQPTFSSHNSLTTNFKTSNTNNNRRATRFSITPSSNNPPQSTWNRTTIPFHNTGATNP